MGVNSLPKTVNRQRRGCDLHPGPSAPESSTLTTRLPSHSVPSININFAIVGRRVAALAEVGSDIVAGLSVRPRGTTLCRAVICHGVDDASPRRLCQQHVLGACPLLYFGE